MNQHKPVEQIIVIGVSSGGLAALRVLLEQFPRDLPAAVFITMHIGDQPSLLPSLLTHTSSLDIGFAANGARPGNGSVYIAPPDKHLLIKHGVMQLVRSAKENHARPAIDPMFRSAATSYGDRAIGVLLTGELDDGVVGLQAIKAYGGQVFVQDPDTAEAPSMPRNALRHVQVDVCLPLNTLGTALVQAVRQRADGAHSSEPPSRIEPFATENDLTENLSRGGAYALDAIGKVAGISCPECGGALWQVGETPPRYRCHTGHAYTSRALFEAQNETVEEALWVAIRALHEKQLLLGRLIQSSKDHGRTTALKEYELTSEGLENHKDTLRGLLTSMRSVE